MGEPAVAPTAEQLAAWTAREQRVGGGEQRASLEK
jgi:hypothetical protein